MFRKLLAITLPVFVLACSNAEGPASKNAEIASQTVSTAANAMDVKTKAVLIYADWCGSCKVLDPKIEKVKSMGAIPGMEFVVLDYTDKDEAAFYAQAKNAGVEEAVKNHLNGKVKTGQLVLVDMDDQTVRGTVTKTFETPEILSAIKEAIAAS